MGCGWLGLPLAERLIQEGYRVKGATTRWEKMARLEQAGIIPYLIQLGVEGITGTLLSFLESETLVLNIPPGRRNPHVNTEYPASIQHLLDILIDTPVKNIVFVSSTSVLGAHTGWVDEDTPPAPQTSSGSAILEVEHRIQQLPLAWSIIRMGGLVGPQRHPGRFLAGKQNVPRGTAPVNLIHLEDAVNILTLMLELEVRGEIMHAVADQHPSREELYVQAAQRLGLEPPVFLSDTEAKGKIVRNQKVKTLLGYSFVYPNPLEML